MSSSTNSNAVGTAKETATVTQKVDQCNPVEIGDGVDAEVLRGKRARDADEDGADRCGEDGENEDPAATALETKNTGPRPSATAAAAKRGGGKKKPTPKNKKREEEEAAGDDAVPGGKTPTMKEFTSLITKKNPCVDWVGSYTTARDTGIEIGFLKKEAMVMTTLLSYYQYDGEGATSCPVAMVSGQASIGRKLAIFYSSCKTGTPYWYRGHSRVKVGLGIGFKMENQKMKTLAKLGRADFYLGTLDNQLQIGLSKTQKVVLNVTEEGKLQLNPAKLRMLASGHNTRHYMHRTPPCCQELLDFEEEIYQSNQIDIVNIFLKHLEFSDLAQKFTLAIKNNYLSLAQLMIQRQPSLVAESCLPDLLDAAISSQHLDMVTLLLDSGADPTKPNPSLLNQQKLYPIHYAVNRGPYNGWYHVHECYRSTEIVQALLDRGCSIDVRDNDGCSPLRGAIIQEDLEMFDYLLPLFPAGFIDLRRECMFPSWKQDKMVRWLVDVGRLIPDDNGDDILKPDMV